MEVTSFGFLKPDNGETGSVVFPALNTNTQKLNDHTHNGVNSAKLTSTSVEGVTQSILSAAWVATTGGYYRQVITVPPNLTYGKFFVAFQNPSGHQIFPTVEKIDATSFYVYTIDNSEGMTAIYV